LTIVITVFIFLAYRNFEFTCTEQKAPYDMFKVTAELWVCSVELAPFHLSAYRNLDMACRFLENLLTLAERFDTSHAVLSRSVIDHNSIN
jgi:hypothetical protein